jgi:hypothetical protein
MLQRHRMKLNFSFSRISTQIIYSWGGKLNYFPAFQFASPLKSFPWSLLEYVVDFKRSTWINDPESSKQMNGSAYERHLSRVINLYAQIKFRISQ